MAYFGEASKALSYFASRGLQCTSHYNPADYMSELYYRSQSKIDAIIERVG